MSNFIEGKRVYLRPFEEEDIITWFDWFNDPEVTLYMNKGVFPNTKQLQEEYFKKLLTSKNDVQLAIVLKENDTLIGAVGIHKIDWIHRNSGISIMIGDKTLWGKGLAEETIAFIVRHAFTKMNLHKVTAGMMAENYGSRKCFEDNGFVLEGMQKEQFFYKDRYVDVYLLGLTRKKWEEDNRRRQKY
ncbi:MAG: putative ribosomal N-acetyltransferase YdaF [Candidatus Scalindua rubra]|uniref:Putative ribosomal N-acetyltransferase YdaF n=1 Tax=Candidatus Scalindua rubra TaxID=1872076 RepID=A0A1E3XDR8_9BACT|nr:MAG: putative ribosomal N-acetyltransferase YdaF [Candidatus Scalindua rubra]